MGWQDRPYYRDGFAEQTPWQRVARALFGSVPLFTVFGIRVRAHASLLWYIGLSLLLGLGEGFAWQDRVISMAMLFGVVLLHEFGHCFAARWVGGSADDILMHPLGGFAMAAPPRRPLPTFITVAAGPAVNLALLVVSGTALFLFYGWLPLNPIQFASPGSQFPGWLSIYRYLFWFYEINFTLLAFNLLPIFPLDGGQMLQAALWPKLGYYKSVLFSCWTGMVCGTLGAVVAVASHEWGLGILAAMGILYCYQERLRLFNEFPDGAGDETDYSAAYEPQTPRKKARNQRALNRAKKIVQQHRDESVRIDQILAKVSATGMNSLSRVERKILRKATEQRRRDIEVSS